MKRRSLIVVLFALLILAVIVGRARQPASPERVYALTAVTAGLARQPGTWVGRTVLVRGTAIESSWPMGSFKGMMGEFCYARHHPCPLTRPNGVVYLMVGPARSPARLATNYVTPFVIRSLQHDGYLNLRVRLAPLNPVQAFVQQFPFLRSFLSVNNQAPGDVGHVYRVRLLPPSYGACSLVARAELTTCADGDLLAA